MRINFHVYEKNNFVKVPKNLARSEYNFVRSSKFLSIYTEGKDWLNMT